MKVNSIIRLGDKIYRILCIKNNEVLVVDCINKAMPFYISNKELKGSLEISEEELLLKTNTVLENYDSLNPNQKKTVNDKYVSISSIIPIVSNNKLKIAMIKECSTIYKVDEKTIRRRLIDYLIFQNKCIFVPNSSGKVKELTDYEKDFRWALNKYYYNSLKFSLRETYRRLIKDKYCNSNGILLDKFPTFRQFSYYYSKTMTLENKIISREGKSKFMRDYRALLGDGVRDFSVTVGYGMFDSTICDIYLINDRNELIGRPVMTACVDAYSAMCLGYSIGLEGGINSLNDLVHNICLDKVELCNKFGISISYDDWPIRNELPHKFVTDRGKEYIGESFSQLVELGIEIVNLPPYRPELKGMVEKFFDIIQDSFKSELATKGVIQPDYQERGSQDYRKKASLTINDFEKIILLCIIRYNTKKIIDLPYDVVGKVKPFSNELFKYNYELNQDCFIKVDNYYIKLLMLPRCIGSFKRNGLVVNKLRYKNYDYTEDYLKGRSCTVSYNPNDVSHIWLYENGNFIQFDIIESFFENMNLNDVTEVMKKKKQIENESKNVELQGDINLIKEIELVTKSKSNNKVIVDNVRSNRKKELLKENIYGRNKKSIK